MHIDFHLHLFFLTINNGKLGFGYLSYFNGCWNSWLLITVSFQLQLRLLVPVPVQLQLQPSPDAIPTPTPVINLIAIPTLTLDANPDASPTLATPTSTMHLAAIASQLMIRQFGPL